MPRRPARPRAVNPLAPKAPHHAPKAKRVLFLFMAGAPSHLEMFDNKPQLAKFDGTLPPPELIKGYRAAFIKPNSKLLGPKFKFARHGQSGTELSELLPHLATVVDDIAVVKGMVTDAFNHAPGQIMMSTGLADLRPAEHRVAGSATAWAASRRTCPASSFSAPARKGPAAATPTGAAASCRRSTRACSSAPAAIRCLYLSNPRGVDARPAARLARRRQQAQPACGSSEVGDPEIATRINSFEMAFRMQLTAPDVMDIGHEPRHILEMYGAEPGKPSFANTCLLARRLLERGVRFVQIFHESWDQHGNLVHDIKKNCKDTDQACAALIKDLKQRGMLEDTLVVWGGEFGRTPMVQGGGNDGRDHHPNAFSMWLAGGGVKPGITYGETDELGFQVVKDKVHVHDLHATLLHLLGFDHTRLTYRFQGRDFRLTDVCGEVVKGLIA